MSKRHLAGILLVGSILLPTVAEAQDYPPPGYYDRGDRDGYYRGRGNDGYDRRYADGRDYRGRDRRYYQDCRRSNGTTGLLAGAGGGALLGNVLGGGTLGTVLGGVGGGLLGKHLDEKHDQAQNERNGC